jgi:hypothetical protein
LIKHKDTVKKVFEVGWKFKTDYFSQKDVVEILASDTKGRRTVTPSKRLLLLLLLLLLLYEEDHLNLAITFLYEFEVKRSVKNANKKCKIQLREK